MSVPTPPPEILADRPAKRRLSKKARIAAWSAAGAFGVLTVSGIVISQVSAATAEQTPSPSASPSAVPNPGKPDHPGRFGFGLPGPFGFGRALHGEFTVETSDGSYQVVVVQTGTVTAKGSGSVTVKSADGYTATYAVNADTRIAKDGKQAKLDDLANNDTVHVAGVRSGSTVTATFIHDGDLREKGFWRDGERHRWPGPHGPFASPSPSATPS
jgi:hypothetical protein